MEPDQHKEIQVPFVDSHAHLADAAFDADRNEVINRARSSGARAVFCIGESPDAALKSRELVKQHSGFLFFTAGVHPHDAAAFDPEKDPDLIRELVATGAVAVGECGLDYHYDNSPRVQQRRAFTQQLALARELNVPAVVHTRDAEDDTAAIVREAGTAGVIGVLHCFTGSPTLARVALEAGWFLSFSGIITFKRYDAADLLKSLPADRILVESDSPYLAPIPYRGKRNEPSFVRHTVQKLAGYRGEEVTAVASVTADNALRFFGVASHTKA